MMDIELLNTAAIINGLRFPYKVSKVTQVVIAAGEISCIVDFFSYNLKSPSMAIFFPGQIIESIDASEDFRGFGMVTSEAFTDSLNLPVSFQERLSFKSKHFYTLNQEGLDAFSNCYTMVKSIMNQEGHPYKKEIISHLFSAYYYGLGYYVHNSRQQKSVMTVLNMVSTEIPVRLWFPWTSSLQTLLWVLTRRWKPKKIK